jgi:hypothetical protein
LWECWAITSKSCNLEPYHSAFIKGSAWIMCELEVFLFGNMCKYIIPILLLAHEFAQGLKSYEPKYS